MCPGELTLAFHQERCIWELTRAEKPIIKKTVEPFVTGLRLLFSEQGESLAVACPLVANIDDTEIIEQTLEDKVKRLIQRDVKDGNF